MTTKRELVVNVPVTAEEHAMLREIAESNDEPMTMTVRRWIKSFHRERFGAVPKAAKARR